MASGPAEEIKNIPKYIDDYDRLEVHLLDQDILSLQYAQMNVKYVMLEHGKKLDLKLLNKSIKDVIKLGLDLNDYDLIYSAGLFDYFKDSVAIEAAKKLYDSLNPGGTLVIGNFDFDPHKKVFMESLFDWDLIYRSKEELTDLYGGICDEFTIEKEKEEINLFAILKKHG